MRKPALLPQGKDLDMGAKIPQQETNSFFNK